jgi:hypothetical protein
VGWFAGRWTENVLGDALNCWGDEGESALGLADEDEDPFESAGEELDTAMDL